MERGYMKSEDEQMLQRIMDIDTMGYACIYDSSGKREEYLIALTAENLANLIGGKGGEARQISVTDVLDRLMVDSRMETLGSCLAQRLCRKINQFLASIQRGEEEAGEILAVCRDATDEYFAAKEKADILTEYQMLFFIYSSSKREL
jgi:hypothetical protein